MPFPLTFYKDCLIDRLVDCKDKAFAALSTLDNRDTKIRSRISTTFEDGMPCHPHGPLIHERSRSKCKQSIEREYAIAKDSDPSDDEYSDDSGTDCSCDKCPIVIRGRPPRRGPYLIEADGGLIHQNVSQQNINVMPDCHGHVWRGRSRSRSVVIVRDRGCHDHWMHEPRYVRVERRPSRHRHSPGRSCHRPTGRQDHEHGRLPQGCGPFQVVQSEDGRLDMYNVKKVVENALEAGDSWKRQQNAAKEVEAKRINDRLDLLSRVYGPRQNNAAALPAGHASPLSAWGARGILPNRSADEIRREIEKCEADLTQCRAWAALKAKTAADINRADVLGQIQPVCSGALKPDEEVKKNSTHKISVKKKVGFHATQMENEAGRGKDRKIQTNSKIYRILTSR